MTNIDSKIFIIKQKDGSRIRNRKAQYVKCEYCGNTFLKPINKIKSSLMHFCCKEHRHLHNKHTNGKVVKCSYCGNSFHRSNSRLLNSKSGLYFCNRKCKEFAQSLNGGITEIQPSHYGYGNGAKSYRSKAFGYYGRFCELCGYEEHPKLLQVHHIDSNRMNNKVNNLIVLCPTCHFAITIRIAVLVSRKLVWND